MNTHSHNSDNNSDHTSMRIFPHMRRSETRVATDGNFNHNHNYNYNYNYNHRYKSLDQRAKTKDTPIVAARNYSNNITSKRTTVAADHFLLEPTAMWEDPGAKMSKVRTLQQNHSVNDARLDDCPPPSTEKQPYNKEADTDAETMKKISYLSPQQVVDFLMQRQQFLQTHKTNDNASQKLGAPFVSSPSPNTVTNEVNLHIDSDYFLDGCELERNVVVDYATDRSYVYTTDVETKWKLPEFLYLDVPNSIYAARACGQFVTNKLILDLNQIVHRIGSSNKNRRQSALECLVKSCNKSDYEVENIFVPREQIFQKHGQAQNNILNGTSNGADTLVEAITAKFRLRYVRVNTKIHKMLRHNFMNGQKCARGILVFIPCMEANSPADRFWGSLPSVDPLPTIDQSVSNVKMDTWCMRVALQHGTYHGKDPETLGLVVLDCNDNNNKRETLGPFSKPGHSKPTRVHNLAMKQKPIKRAIKKADIKTKKAVVTTRKKATPKKKVATKSVLAGDNKLRLETDMDILRQVLHNARDDNTPKNSTSV